jgi:hypothetical protein
MQILGICGIAIAIACLCASQALADCRDDLVKADQDFSKSRTALNAASNAPPPVRCAAYRRHVASLTQISKVFARCDTGSDKAKNATQTTSALADFRRQMNEVCKK